MKRDDPKVLKARAAREATWTKLEILLRGVAQTIEHGYFTDMEGLQPLLDVMNIDVVNAMKDHEKAVTAWLAVSPRRLRVHRWRPRKKAA
jgi:hypothetical protein